MEFVHRLQGVVGGFNAQAATNVYIGRKAAPYIEHFFSELGDDTLIAAIRGNLNLIEILPAEYVANLKELASKAIPKFGLPYPKTLDYFTNEILYSWLPARTRLNLEHEPGGKDWLYFQFDFLRSYLKS